MSFNIELQVPAGTSQATITAVRDAVYSFVPRALSLAQQGCPVNTGKFRKSWFVEVSAQGNVIIMEIGNRVSYAEYVHPRGDPTLWVDTVAQGVANKLKYDIQIAAAQALHTAIVGTLAMPHTRGAPQQRSSRRGR